VSYIIIRKKGPFCKPCDKCDHEIEVFSKDAAEARFLIVRLADRPFLGGGKCPTCGQNVCISCAIKTVYGRGLRRLHCPECGDFLMGLMGSPDSQMNMGAFLEEPPEFAGRKSKDTPAESELDEVASKSPLTD
jgi:hypothetical protein